MHPAVPYLVLDFSDSSSRSPVNRIGNVGVTCGFVVLELVAAVPGIEDGGIETRLMVLYTHVEFVELL